MSYASPENATNLFNSSGNQRANRVYSGEFSWGKRGGASGSMETEEYDRLARAENELWWFKAQIRNVLAIMSNLDLPQADYDCVDVGCGTGGFVRQLEQSQPNWKVAGIDLSEQALRYARQSSSSEFIQSNAMNLPFDDGAVSLIVSLDVLYHQAVTTEGFLKEMHRVLAVGGHLVLSNPSYEWLRSYHDEHVHTARRYTRNRIAKDLEDNGFRVHVTGHWNTVLFPLMVLKRKVFTGAGDASDVHEISSLLNTLFNFLTLPEAFLIRRGFNIPFGGSVLAVGVKK